MTWSLLALPCNFTGSRVDSIRATAAELAAQRYAERQKMTEQLGSGLWCAEKCTRNAQRSILGRYIRPRPQPCR